jgi:hypothetical protein
MLLVIFDTRLPGWSLPNPRLDSGLPIFEARGYFLGPNCPPDLKVDPLRPIRDETSVDVQAAH